MDAGSWQEEAMRSTGHADIPDILKLRIYEVVQAVPPGSVSTYGDIATIVGGGIDAWTIGQALNQVPKHHDQTVPWQRIVNAQGGISTKGLLQRTLLEDEGVTFNVQGKINLRQFRWRGPAPEWATEHGYQTLPPDEPEAEQLSLL
jgi:methylated-DNA-protein-cysteine methyltransferase-like protein